MPMPSTSSRLTPRLSSVASAPNRSEPTRPAAASWAIAPRWEARWGRVARATDGAATGGEPVADVAMVMAPR